MLRFSSTVAAHPTLPLVVELLEDELVDRSEPFAVVEIIGSISFDLFVIYEGKLVLLRKTLKS